MVFTPVFFASVGMKTNLRDMNSGILVFALLLVLAAVLAAAAVIHRPFCRYLCPLGAFYALFNRFSFYQMKLDKSKCTGCKKCEHACPMAVEVTKGCGGPECIRCGRCVRACPVECLHFGNRKPVTEIEKD